MGRLMSNKSANFLKESCNRIKVLKLEHFTYLPFVGWWLTAAFKKDDEYAMEHAKKALTLAIFFAFALIFFGISFAFVSNQSRILRMILTIIIYLLDITYIILCIIETKRIFSKKDSGLSFLDKFAKIPDFL
jgi:hypothetical protein